MLENCDYPFICDNCDRSFKRNDHLKRHEEAVHCQIKYSCNVCGKKMSRKDHLKRHIANVHPSVTYPNNPHSDNNSFVNGEVAVQNQPKPKVYCEYCHEGFLRKDNAARHVRCVHPEVYAMQLRN